MGRVKILKDNALKYGILGHLWFFLWQFCLVCQKDERCLVKRRFSCSWLFLRDYHKDLIDQYILSEVRVLRPLSSVWSTEKRESQYLACSPVIQNHLLNFWNSYENSNFCFFFKLPIVQNRTNRNSQLFQVVVRIRSEIQAKILLHLDHHQLNSADVDVLELVFVSCALFKDSDPMWMRSSS